MLKNTKKSNQIKSSNNNFSVVKVPRESLYFRAKPIWRGPWGWWVSPTVRVLHLVMGVLKPCPTVNSHWPLLLLWWNSTKGEIFVSLQSRIQSLQTLSVLSNLQCEKLLRRPSGHSWTTGMEQLHIPRSTATKYAPRQLLEAQLLQCEYSQSVTKVTLSEVWRTFLSDSELHL